MKTPTSIERCGSITEGAYHPAFPLPTAGEMIHAVDGSQTVIFIWHPRLSKRGRRRRAYDSTRVNLVRAAINADGAAVPLAAAHAVKNPAWVATIIADMGFDLCGSRFGSTKERDIPADQFEFLDDALASLDV